jgi:DNA-binding protein HU-beta
MQLLMPVKSRLSSDDDTAASISKGAFAQPFAPGAIPCRIVPRAHRRFLLLNHPLEGARVNKTELIEHIAKKSEISKAAAARALDSMIEGVKVTLKKGGTVTLIGFGTFAATKRPARTGRNPRTGAAIKIKAAKVPKFRPGKGLKDALN